MRILFALVVLALAGCSDTQYPEVVYAAERQCVDRGGVDFSFVDAYSDLYSIDTHCKDGTLISYNLKRTDR